MFRFLVLFITGAQFWCFKNEPSHLGKCCIMVKGPFIYRAIENKPIPDPLPPPCSCPAIKWLPPPTIIAWYMDKKELHSLWLEWGYKSKPKIHPNRSMHAQLHRSQEHSHKFYLKGSVLVKQSIKFPKKFQNVINKSSPLTGRKATICTLQ